MGHGSKKPSSQKVTPFLREQPFPTMGSLPFYDKYHRVLTSCRMMTTKERCCEHWDMGFNRSSSSCGVRIMPAVKGEKNVYAQIEAFSTRICPMTHIVLKRMGQIGVTLIMMAVMYGAEAWALVVHHDLTIELHPDRQELIGHDIVTIEGWKSPFIELMLAPQARIRGVNVGDKTVPYDFDGGRLRIETAGKKREKTAVGVSYAARFNDPVPRNPLHTEDPSYGVTGVILPEGTFLLSGAAWYPDLSLGDSRFRLTVKGPAGYEAVTSGSRVSRITDAKGTTSVWEIERGQRGLALSAGPYVIEEKLVDGTKVSAYFFQEDAHLMETYLTATARYLQLYNTLIGPYPFDKFAIVENFFPTGYGFPSYTLLGRSVIRLPFIVETSLGHEVAHSWWGNGVWVDYGKGNWSEGLTTYVADYLYKEQSSPKEGRDYRLKILRDYATLVSPENDFPLRLFMGRVSPSSRVIGYGKCAMVFHMARRIIGDTAFWEGLSAVYGKKLFQRASWTDFADALGKSGNKDLTLFFQQWIDRTGAPRLRLENVMSEKTESGWRMEGSLTQSPPYFDLVVPVSLETADGMLMDPVMLSGKSTSFFIHAEASPRKLVVDPDTDLFRQLEPTEIPATINSIKAAPSLLVVASRDLAAETLNTSKMILEALGHKEAAVIPEDQIQPTMLQKKDALFLGIPGNTSLLSPPKEVAFSKNRFMINKKTYEDPEDALFMVYYSETTPQRSIGLFLPLSQEAASKVIRKIPHYGKHSYLVFRGGVNQAKGTWPVRESSLIHYFQPEESEL